MNDDDVGDAQARRLGAILEDLVLSGAPQEVLGSFALRHVRRMSADFGQPAQLGVSDMEVLLERFGKQVAREVLREKAAVAANDTSDSPDSLPTSTTSSMKTGAVKATKASNARTSPSFLPEPGSLVALLSSPSRKITCKLMGRSTSISVPADLHAALIAQVGPTAVRGLITQWALKAPETKLRSQFVQDQMASAWQQNNLMATGTPFQGLLQ